MEKMTRKAGSAKRRGLGKSPALAAPPPPMPTGLFGGGPHEKFSTHTISKYVTKKKNLHCIKYGAYDLEE